MAIPPRARWGALLAVLVAAVTAGAAYEYRGLTDGRPGGTISEAVFAHAGDTPLGAACIWGGLLAIAASLAWHFTAGRGTRWPGRRD